ncbi:hypothetical protein Q8W71_19850 [Methylobacterium sp. NEAU 140]|uniref:hypothetical protein n=1 Tax=Methylobacterium sp. NEAU 140 TaxID=3064945 RepID=UPI0027327516|nr:hypothetical protein [Methylobacterium sp. NEAU 140]MDP4024888.1 hypothetical protein [Methylobacterium sp. NEAU 140]
MSLHKMYFWKPVSGAQGGVGHASLDIDFGAGPGKAEYVSWWPGGTGSKGSPGASAGTLWELFPAGAMSYDTDTGPNGEGRQPDDAVELDNILDADLMRESYARIKTDMTYNILNRSCATMVAKVMLAGGGILSVRYAMAPIAEYAWTPASAHRLAKMIKADAAVIRARLKYGI